jgi:hypothetical protein
MADGMIPAIGILVGIVIPGLVGIATLGLVELLLTY